MHKNCYGNHAGSFKPKRLDGETGTLERTISPSDFMKEFYLARLEDGWTLSEIDDADFFYFIELINYRQRTEVHTIDELF
jgi:hypothetical protein